MLNLNLAAATHVGVTRPANQDCLHVDGWSAARSGTSLEVARDSREPFVVAVIDGMGGHPGGELASWTASRAIDDLQLRAATTAGELNATVQLLSDRVHEAGAVTRGMALMGATTAGFVARRDGLILFNVGDCSILRISDGYVGQLAVIDRVDTGDGGRQGVVGQCLGGSAVPVAIDAHAELFVPSDGERLLLCSDGLTDCVPFEDIASVSDTADDPLRLAHALIEMACRNGGPDNISIIVADIHVDESSAIPDSGETEVS